MNDRSQIPPTADLKKIFHLVPPLTAGLVAVLVGFTSSIALLLQAAKAIGANPDQTSSMIAALFFGAGITSIIFSHLYRKPILMAFSTAASALLATNTTAASFSDMIGAFIFSGVLIVIAGQTGWFEKILNRIPIAITSAMLAGVLVKFGLEVFTSTRTQPALIFVMLTSYVVFKRFRPRYAVIAVLIAGFLTCATLGLLHLETLTLHMSIPVLTWPTFSAATLIGVGLPVFVVTMTSQNITGLAIVRAAGYNPPISPLITGSGWASLLLAPFGCYGINLAAITAAIVMGPEAHEDPKRRHFAAIAAGWLYIAIAIFAASITQFFQVLPVEFVVSLAGIALFSTIANSLAGALRDETVREAALLTFLVTTSGFSMVGIGSAFWGLIAGAISLTIFQWKKVRAH